MGSVVEGIGGLLGANSLGRAGDRAFQQAQFSPFNVSSPFGSAKFKDDKLNLSLSPELQRFNEMFMGRSEDLFDQASAFDVEGMAGDQTDLLRRLAEPFETQQRLGMENRLFSQGRLGSTGGAQQFGQLMQAQGQNDLQRQLQSLALANQQQDRLFNQAQGLFGNAINVQQLPMGLGQLGGNLGAQQSSANAAAAQFPFMASANKAKATADFFGGIGQGINALMSGGG